MAVDLFSLRVNLQSSGSAGVMADLRSVDAQGVKTAASLNGIAGSLPQRRGALEQFVRDAGGGRLDQPRAVRLVLGPDPLRVSERGGVELGLMVEPVSLCGLLQPVRLGQQGEVNEGEVVILEGYDPHGAPAGAGDSGANVPVGSLGGEAVAPAAFPANSSRNLRA